MVDLPVHPSAARFVQRAGGLLDVAELLDGPVEEVGIAARLLARLEPADLDGTAVPVAELVGAAALESDRLGDITVRPEHLVLGWARLAAEREDGRAPELERVRAELQWVMAERAQRVYEQLAPAYRPDAGRPPRTVLLAGVPGTGKSTLAEGLARRLRAPVFSMDWQLGALVPFGALRPDNSLPLAEVNLTASIARQVQLGLDVVVDATGHRREVRRRWRAVTERLGGVFVGVECVCSDEDVQRGRVEGRSRGIPGWHSTVSWEHVLRMKERWERWDEPHLVVDSASESPDQVLAKVLTAVDAAG